MTSEFELAMQSVSPAFAMPYWDVTIDAAIFKKEDGLDDTPKIFSESKLFQDDYFGKTDSKTHIVTGGRFAFQEIAQNFSFATRSPYGFLRAPWNINPVGYVSRFHKMCGISPYAAMSFLEAFPIMVAGGDSELSVLMPWLQPAEQAPVLDLLLLQLS